MCVVQVSWSALAMKDESSGNQPSSITTNNSNCCMRTYVALYTYHIRTNVPLKFMRPSGMPHRLLGCYILWIPSVDMQWQ